MRGSASANSLKNAPDARSSAASASRKNPCEEAARSAAPRRDVTSARRLLRTESPTRSAPDRTADATATPAATARLTRQKYVRFRRISWPGRISTTPSLAQTRGADHRPAASGIVTDHLVTRRRRRPASGRGVATTVTYDEFIGTLSMLAAPAETQPALRA